MIKAVIFSVEELYNLIHDKPVFCKDTNTVYMSQDCYEKQNSHDTNTYVSVDLANGADLVRGTNNG